VEVLLQTRITFRRVTYFLDNNSIHRPVLGTGTLQLFLLCLVVFSLIAATCGCRKNQGPERIVVFGSVTYKGKPVINGLIRFVPDPSLGLPVAVASIVNGKYRVDSHGGVPAGTHSVQIEGYETPENTTTFDPMSGGLALGPPYIPDKYNKQTILKFTVPSGSGPIEKNFDLE